VTEDQANAVYDVLVEHAGASEEQRDEFVIMHVNGRCDEYRFIGSLGFGGKFWRHDWRVSCYREDETPERVEAIRITNEALAGVRRLPEHVIERIDPA
jgi:hypothetical protein